MLEYMGETVQTWAILTGYTESTIRRKIKSGKPILKEHEVLEHIDGEPVILDKDISDVILTLNRKGYKTKACCSGHVEHASWCPYIVFDFDTAPTREQMPLFISIYQENFGKQCSVVIYFSAIMDLIENTGNTGCLVDYGAYLKDLHKNLKEWADRLPDRSVPKIEESVVKALLGEPTLKLEESTVRIYNVSKDHVNYSQRNNEVNPSKSCNTTSMTMAASYMPEVWKLFKESPIYKKYSKKFKQPEDCLQQYMLDSGLRPTFHEDLCRAFNQFVGKTVAKFSMTVSLTKLVNELKAGRPAVISGDFPKSDGKILSHIVCLVGCIFNNENKTNVPDYWIIDDPYGDTLNDWKGSGNDIKISHEYFMKNIKEKGKDKKWAHTFSI